MNNKKKERVVVTGGAGFIGSHIADACLEKGYDVHIIDNLSGGKEENINPKAIFHKVDIRDEDAISPIIAGTTFVFHTAALPRVQYSIEHPEETNEVNVGGTLNVLNAARNGKVQKVIYSASSSAYGDQSVLPLREDMPADPKSPYGLQKYIGELYCKLFSDVYGLDTVSLRYFNVYGPNEYHKGEMRSVVHKAFEQVRDTGKVRLFKSYKPEYKDGEQKRDFIYVKDAIDMTLYFLDHQDKNGIFNIGTGHAQTWVELVNALFDAVGKPVNIEFFDMPEENRENYQYFTEANMKKMRNAGYDKTILNIREGVTDYVKNYLLKDIYLGMSK